MVAYLLLMLFGMLTIISSGAALSREIEGFTSSGQFLNPFNIGVILLGIIFGTILLSWSFPKFLSKCLSK